MSWGELSALRVWDSRRQTAVVASISEESHSIDNAHGRNDAHHRACATHAATQAGDLEASLSAEVVNEINIPANSPA
jgi:hypothetical protein